MKNKISFLVFIIFWLLDTKSYTQTCDTNKIKEFCFASQKKIAVSVVEACNLANNAYNLAKECKESNLYLQSAVVLAGALYQRDLGDSTISFVNAVLKERPNASPYYKAALYHKLSSCYIMTMQLQPGLKYCFEALKNYEIIHDTPNVANIYVNIANVYQQQRNFNLAAANLRKALSIAKKSKQKTVLGNVYNTIGILYAENQKLDSAEYFFINSTAIREELNDNTSICWNYNNLGGLYVLLNRPKKAIFYLEKALGKFVLNKNYDGQSSVANNLAELYVKLKDNKQAFYYFNYSRQLYNETNNPDNLENLYANLSVYYDNTGDLKTAFKYSDSLINLKNLLYGKRLDKSTAEMQTKYETEKKEKENALLIDENKIKTLELSQKEQQRKILIGSFVLIMLLGGIIYNHYRLKNKNKILQERALRASAVFQAHEEEKIRISKDLHDGVGPLLSLIKLNISSLETNSSNEKIIEKTKELASESIKEVRNISHSLMPGLLSKSGLQSALTELVEQINSESISVELDCKISSSLKPEAELNIYRITQESLNNILKHAVATKAKINLEEKNQNLQITINDNGSGFDKNKLTSSSGNGLNNIYSRVDFMKGKINLESTAAGTNLNILVPLKEILNG